MSTATATKNRERLAPGMRPKANDIVVEAMEILNDDGFACGFKAVDRMLRRMWADEARAERNRVADELRIIRQEGSLRNGHERIASDPVGELATDLADYIKIRWTA